MKTFLSRSVPTVFAAMAFAAASLSAAAQDTQLASQQARIADPVIQADYDGYLALL